MPNLLNIFELIEKKRGFRVPLQYKLTCAPELITEEDLDVKGDLYLYNWGGVSLPEGLKVGGSLDLTLSKIKSLPPDLKVGENLNLRLSKIISLPSGLEVGRDFNISYTKITIVPQDLKVGGDLDTYATPIGREYDVEEIKEMCPGVKGKIMN